MRQIRSIDVALVCGALFGLAFMVLVALSPGGDEVLWALLAMAVFLAVGLCAGVLHLFGQTQTRRGRVGLFGAAYGLAAAIHGGGILTIALVPYSTAAFFWGYMAMVLGMLCGAVVTVALVICVIWHFCSQKAAPHE